MSFLVISNILVSTYQYIDTSDGGGSAIHCLIDKALRKKYQSMINTFCWINSTFTLPKYHEEIVLPGMPGVGKSLFHNVFKRRTFGKINTVLENLISVLN